MALLRKQGFGSGTKKSCIIRGHVSLYLHHLGQPHRRGEDNEEGGTGRQLDGKLPEDSGSFLFAASATLSHLACTQRTSTEVRRLQDIYVTKGGKKGRSLWLNTKVKESINNAEGKTEITRRGGGGARVILGCRDRSCGSESWLRPFTGRTTGGRLQTSLSLFLHPQNGA